jgi:hypothetical protein
VSNGERIEEANGVLWDYIPVDPPPVADRVRAVVRARLIDEITREPVESNITVRTSRHDLMPRVARDGLIGLVGQPMRSLPMLGGSDVTLDMRVTCPGYAPLTLSDKLGPIVGYPNSFAPLDFHDVMLHRIGIAIEGRVVRRTSLTPPPLPGATVAIDAMWSNLPPANWTPPALAEAPRVISLTPGMYAPRVATTQVRERTLTPTGTAKTLTASVDPGSNRVRLSDRDGLALGNVLLIDGEAIPIAAIEPTLAPDLPTWITLAQPCARLHRHNVVCTAVSVGVPTANAATARAGMPGDCVAFLSSAPAFTNNAWIEIDDGVNPREFQRVGLYQTVADANGYFRLPPISRVALVRLLVKSPGLTDAQPIITLAYPSVIQPVTVSLE